MSENVFNLIGLGRQSGDFEAPGSAVPTTLLYPVESPVGFELDRGSAISKQDRGRNVRNAPGAGYHGIRGASATLPSQVRFGDFMNILEMSHAGNITPATLGGGLYRYDYPFEALAPTVVPNTVEGGNIDDASAQMRLVSALCGSLTIGFPALSVPGAAPWTLSADLMAFDREIVEVTPGIEASDVLEVAQGQYSRIYEGATSEAFADLAELIGLKSFTMTAQRNLVGRAYGSDSDLASKFGFTDQSNSTFTAQVAISNDSKSDFHDIWNVATPEPIGERHWRLLTLGGGGKMIWVDARVAILAVPYGEADGERLFDVSGEYVDDETLEANHQISVVTTVASLT